jgi:hypothetical protein
MGIEMLRSGLNTLYLMVLSGVSLSGLGSNQWPRISATSCPALFPDSPWFHRHDTDFGLSRLWPTPVRCNHWCIVILHAAVCTLKYFTRIRTLSENSSIALTLLDIKAASNLIDLALIGRSEAKPKSHCQNEFAHVRWR